MWTLRYRRENGAKVQTGPLTLKDAMLLMFELFPAVAQTAIEYRSATEFDLLAIEGGKVVARIAKQEGPTDEE